MIEGLRMAFWAGVILGSFIFQTPAEAHTELEQDQWIEQWYETTIAKKGGITPEALSLLSSFRDRHPPEVQISHALVVVRADYGSGVEQWRGLVTQFFPASEIETAMRVMECESRGDPYAYNRSSASGLFQLVSHWYSGRSEYPAFDPFDPVENIKAAAWLQSEVGWALPAGWACY